MWKNGIDVPMAHHLQAQVTNNRKYEKMCLVTYNTIPYCPDTHHLAAEC